MEKVLVLQFEDPRITKGENLYTAFCDELGLASCGESDYLATENLKNAIKAYCSALNERGILIKRLTEKGVKVKVTHPKPSPYKVLIPIGMS